MRNAPAPPHQKRGIYGGLVAVAVLLGVMALGRSGGWRRAGQGHAPESAAAPAATAEGLIREIVAQKAAMGLPRTFDDYVVEDVTASGATLTYHTRLLSVRAGSIDTMRAESMLRRVLAPRACADAPSREVLDRGGLFVYRFVDASGAYLAKVWITRGDCP